MPYSEILTVISKPCPTCTGKGQTKSVRELSVDVPAGANAILVTRDLTPGFDALVSSEDAVLAEVKADYWAIFDVPEKIEPGLDALGKPEVTLRLSLLTTVLLVVLIPLLTPTLGLPGDSVAGSR